MLSVHDVSAGKPGLTLLAAVFVLWLDPAFAKALRTERTASDFRESAALFDAFLTRVHTASTELLRSRALVSFVKAIVAVANLLNDGTALPAPAFLRSIRAVLMRVSPSTGNSLMAEIIRTLDQHKLHGDVRACLVAEGRLSKGLHATLLPELKNMVESLP
jgi:hypothetical protein